MRRLRHSTDFSHRVVLCHTNHAGNSAALLNTKGGAYMPSAACFLPKRGDMYGKHTKKIPGTESRTFGDHAMPHHCSCVKHLPSRKLKKETNCFSVTSLPQLVTLVIRGRRIILIYYCTTDDLGPSFQIRSRRTLSA